MRTTALFTLPLLALFAACHSDPTDPPTLCTAQQAASQTVASDVETALAVNPSSCLKPGAGTWLVTGYVIWTPDSLGSRGVKVYQDDSLLLEVAARAPATYGLTQQFSTAVTLGASDSLRVTLLQNTGATTSTFVNNQFRSFVQVVSP